MEDKGGKRLARNRADAARAALGPTDLLYAKFADEFEKRYVSQGFDENRTWPSHPAPSAGSPASVQCCR